MRVVVASLASAARRCRRRSVRSLSLSSSHSLSRSLLRPVLVLRLARDTPSLSVRRTADARYRITSVSLASSPRLARAHVLDGARTYATENTFYFSKPGRPASQPTGPEQPRECNSSLLTSSACYVCVRAPHVSRETGDDGAATRSEFHDESRREGYACNVAAAIVRLPSRYSRNRSKIARETFRIAVRVCEAIAEPADHSIREFRVRQRRDGRERVTLSQVSVVNVIVTSSCCRFRH